MNEIDILLGQLNFNRGRTIGFLQQLEDSPVGMEALYWRMPFGKGRAHIAWQYLHLSATYNKFAFYVDPKNCLIDDEFVKNFGHGSNPDENKKFSFEELRKFLVRDSGNFINFYKTFSADKLDEKPEATDRTYKEIFYLMNWHECIHIGQSQITWNAFRASKGMMD